MKRGGPLPRLTPLVARSGLRRSRLDVSPRQARRPKPAPRRTGPGADAVALVLARSGHRCEVCPTGTGEQIHHRRPRASGGSRRADTNSPVNLLHLCSACHAEIESHRNWAVIHGRLLQQHQDPATTAVELHAHGWVLLLDDGRVQPAAPPPEGVDDR